MTGEPSSSPRRQRRRGATPDAVSASEPARAKPLRPADHDRALADLVGAGRSQVGVSGAMRARDVDRPTEDDLAWAEANVILVRRHWTPPANGR